MSNPFKIFLAVVTFFAGFFREPKTQMPSMSRLVLLLGWFSGSVMIFVAAFVYLHSYWKTGTPVTVTDLVTGGAGSIAGSSVGYVANRFSGMLQRRNIAPATPAESEGV